ncbi:hypothetical protein [Paraburkholderia sp. EG304]|uniref:hypothetical protein n=1 Tax=Paraburkholderia sp. EG304 TaxID=3237015 RepID=UPI003979B86C
MNKSIYTGIAVEFDRDEYGARRATVTGVQFDAVNDWALDLKNSLPVEVCPEVEGPFLDIETGSYRATVRVRKEQS